ncbi:hypothetical protein AQUCO_03300140v1 [Aquilegia coerulea]|uniref:Uncharacterized protein n=1 Tax=Aquilegia coerulea TaxID=218851 RepID=A0A2G5CZN0_AQUCA|nr:hypothetical protein AQUCO_03300140v1 [Aquilegia coerulea]
MPLEPKPKFGIYTLGEDNYCPKKYTCSCTSKFPPLSPILPLATSPLSRNCPVYSEEHHVSYGNFVEL